MKTCELNSRSLPLDDTWDVIVVGGGPSGSTAATAAAREGARTLLVEATGCLGGMGTSGLVPAWCPFSDGEKMIYRGLAEHVFNACKAGVAHVGDEVLDWAPINPERLKRVYDDMVLGAGARILFNTSLVAVEKAGETLTLILSNKSGLTAYRGRAYVDATGDGDLAAWAGAEYEKGEPGTGDLQPATHCFILSNIDEYAYRHGPQLRSNNPESPVSRILESGKYPLIRDRHQCNNLIGPGTVGFNAGHLWHVDNTDPAGASKALVEGRKIAAAFRDALAEFHPTAFGNAFLVATASLLGVRETRRIMGDYLLTFDDYLARRSFPDEICRNSYFIDIHIAEEEIVREREGRLDWNERIARYQLGESHGIPYRCLTPKGLRSVLVAGRCISCDRKVQASIRVMPVCLTTGEAAGMAAAHAAAMSEPDVHAVAADRLRKRLREEGAHLP